MEKNYNSEVYNVRKLGIPVASSLVLLIIIPFILYKMDILTLKTATLILITPTFFYLLSIVKLREYATRRFDLLFTDENIQVKEYRLKSDTLLSSYSIEWKQVNSYRYWRTSKDNVNHIVITLVDGKTKDWGFQDNKSLNETFSPEGIVGIFHSFIKYYNLNNEHQVILQKGLLNSPTGKKVVNIIGLLFIIEFIIHLMYKPKTSLVSLFAGVMFYLNMWAAMKNNDNIYNRINELE